MFRRRDERDVSKSGSHTTGLGQGVVGYRVPGHPLTTIFFTAVCWSVVAGTVYSYPGNTMIGLAIVLAGIPVYFFWHHWRREE
jgi:hypothetical protein